MAMRFVGSGAQNLSNNGIPLTITGTTSDPKIRANLGAMLKGQMGGKTGSTPSQITNTASTLKGLFHK